MVKYLTNADAYSNDELTSNVIKCRIHLREARALKKAHWIKGRIKPKTKLEKAEQELLLTTKHFEMKKRRELMKKNPGMLPY